MSNSEELKLCPFCGGSGLVQIAPFCGGLKKCPHCGGNRRVCVSSKPETLDTNSVDVKKLDTSTPCVSQNTETLDTNGSCTKKANNSELWSFVRFCRSANDLWAVHDRARDLLATCKENLQVAPKPTYEELEKMVKIEWKDDGDVSRADIAPHFYFKAEGCGELSLVYFYGKWPNLITIRENGEKDLEAQKQNARKFLVDLVADALGVERSGK